MDHSLRAAPHGFSQLATSFLACPRLGILRAPLLRLTRVHFFRKLQPTSYLHLIALADRNDCPQAVAQLPTPSLSNSISAHAIRAELTKIKDPPIIVNPKSGRAYRGSEVGS